MLYYFPHLSARLAPFLALKTLWKFARPPHLFRSPPLFQIGDEA